MYVCDKSANSTEQTHIKCRQTLFKKNPLNSSLIKNKELFMNVTATSTITQVLSNPLRISFDNVTSVW